MRVAVLVVSSFISCVLGIKRCMPERKFTRFYRGESCYKSMLPIVSWRSFNNVSDCMKYAREKNGFAFNFGPPNQKNETQRWNRNCQVLGCPEVGNSTTMVFDPDFDYYTAFGNFNSTENATCIKSLGLFALISEKKNYTEAVQFCQNLGADLADVLGEFRTNSLANMLKSMQNWYKAAYVGLDDIEIEGTFRTPNGNFMDCSSYRAWAVGHPRPHKTKEDCVILDVDRTWRAINCKIRLPFICEFYPTSGRISMINFDLKECDKIKKKKKNQKCLRDNEFVQLYMNSSRIDQCALVNDFDSRF